MFLSAVILAIISSYEFFMITVFTISAACSHTSIQFSMQAYMFFHTTTVRRSLSPYSLCIFSTYRREQDTECRRQISRKSLVFLKLYHIHSNRLDDLLSSN